MSQFSHTISGYILYSVSPGSSYSVFQNICDYQRKYLLDPLFSVRLRMSWKLPSEFPVYWYEFIIFDNFVVMSFLSHFLALARHSGLFHSSDGSEDALIWRGVPERLRRLQLSTLKQRFLNKALTRSSEFLKQDVTILELLRGLCAMFRKILGYVKLRLLYAE